MEPIIVYQAYTLGYETHTIGLFSTPDKALEAIAAYRADERNWYRLNKIAIEMIQVDTNIREVIEVV